MSNKQYLPSYTNSYALVVGINVYQHSPNLGYAVNDADAISQILIDKFGFNKTNVILLKDSEATRSKILNSFMSFVDITDLNDRIIFFFAGHGFTFPGRRGDVGFLVPHDGDSQNLSTLIRWDEITRDGDLILAKHIFFIMDSCYGGLALIRSLLPGSMRFLNDMLSRYSRQVLTAGKADEVVSDSGGPILGHSIFTGHLIDALQGNAATQEGIITANSVMSYVYDKVAKDQNSHQTPHYGFIDGDGDMLFKAPILNSDQSKEEEAKKIGEDILISIPSSLPKSNSSNDIVDLTKEYLSDSKSIIKLHDFTIQKVREVLLLTAEDNFSIQGNWSIEEFQQRLKNYEQIIYDLQRILCCIAYWGKPDHLSILDVANIRLTDRLESQNGLIVWQALRWYPTILLLYSTGISALASNHYDNLSSILLTKIGYSKSRRSGNEFTLAIGEAMLELNRSDAFKHLPGHERQYVPRSEYLFTLLQPMLDDLLFLGRDYERYFDRFEVLFSLVHADLEFSLHPDNNYLWFPLGRFSWKYHNYDTNPLTEIISEAKRAKESWEPIKSGLFGGDYSRFEKISTIITQQTAKLSWD